MYFRREQEASLIASGKEVEFRFPYNPSMLAQLKAQLGPAERRWDAVNKCWRITPGSVKVAQELCYRYGVPLTTDLSGLVVGVGPQRFTIRVNYLGAAKQRENGEYTATGMDEYGTWRYVFPQAVLRKWFGLDDDPTLATSLYGVLGIRKDATTDEIKKAYRAMARRWHPDVNHEDNATEVFKRVQEAYEMLANPTLRGRYNLGLYMEQSARETRGIVIGTTTWRPPLRCGYLDVSAEEKLSGYEVLDIYDWDDIINEAGQIMVASWRYGDREPVYNWR